MGHTPMIAHTGYRAAPIVRKLPEIFELSPAAPLVQAASGH